MKNKKLKIRFIDRQEIRMGSPYRCCGIKLFGAWIPDIPNDQEYQDIKAWSDNGEYLALVRWNISSSNDPGFSIITISLSDKTWKKSKRIVGCCNSLKWEEDSFEYVSYAMIKGKIDI